MRSTLRKVARCDNYDGKLALFYASAHIKTPSSQQLLTEFNSILLVEAQMIARGKEGSSVQSAFAAIN